MIVWKLKELPLKTVTTNSFIPLTKHWIKVFYNVFVNVLNKSELSLTQKIKLLWLKLHIRWGGLLSSLDIESPHAFKATKLYITLFVRATTVILQSRESTLVEKLKELKGTYIYLWKMYLISV